MDTGADRAGGWRLKSWPHKMDQFRLGVCAEVNPLQAAVDQSFFPAIEDTSLIRKSQFPPRFPADELQSAELAYPASRSKTGANGIEAVVRTMAGKILRARSLTLRGLGDPNPGGAVHAASAATGLSAGMIDGELKRHGTSGACETPTPSKNVAMRRFSLVPRTDTRRRSGIYFPPGLQSPPLGPDGA